jgi:hypothetical protein
MKVIDLPRLAPQYYRLRPFENLFSLLNLVYLDTNQSLMNNYQNFMSYHGQLNKLVSELICINTLIFSLSGLTWRNELFTRN